MMADDLYRYELELKRHHRQSGQAAGGPRLPGQAAPPNPLVRPGSVRPGTVSPGAGRALLSWFRS
ncbi:hypothetical protein NYE40_02565 [Paenibacillus sp. FSL W8-1187]|uniref:Uncharacterized protein n=1 Tax=Paenibacillus pasadenensis TaxID=217090 RepID=A0A2N5N0Z6_9BACL|nr:hypothetical protein [Paenibacillus pasadenensis]PLT44002.1 hypothetical protein B8V81_2433 [Paenibacillus pasadenensis]